MGGSKNKLLQLQVLKQHNNKRLHDFNMDFKQIVVNLHKISNVIYKYHNADKKITIIGFPNIFDQTLKHTKHILIPKCIWFDGILSNRVTFVSSSTKNISKNVFRLILKLRKKSDLIVVYNLDNNFSVLKEGCLGRIPVITFTCSKQLDIFNLKTAYSSIKSYNFMTEKSEKNSFFFSFMKAVLNRAKTMKKVRDYQNLNELRDIYKKKNKWRIREISRKK